MSVARITEISASSPTSFEDALRRGTARACETLRGVRGARVKEQQVTVSNDRITEFRVNLLVTFVLEEAVQAPARKAAQQRTAARQHR